MVQKRRLFPHLLDNNVVTEPRGREVSMGDADTSYAAGRNYRSAQVRKNNNKDNNVVTEPRGREVSMGDADTSYAAGRNYRSAQVRKNNNNDYLEGIPSAKGRIGAKYLKNVVQEDDDGGTEVIDMGSPKLPRRVIQSEDTLSDSNGDAKNSRPVKLKCTYKPNPRLYPGPQRKPLRKRRASARGDNASKTSSPSAGHKRRKHPPRRRILRFTPNPRLYRPPPKRVPPPNTPPKKWTPPGSRQSALDTASKVAMQLAESAERQENRQIIFDRNAIKPEYERIEKGKFVCSRCEVPQTKRQVTFKKKENPREKWEVLYKNASDSPNKMQTTYKMTQKNVKFKMNVPGAAVEGLAPPEILTEFLAAIMHGQYGEALQYCRMILEFEPQNTTAQGFYPLLQQKVKAMRALYSKDSESSGTVMRANLHPEDSVATVKRGPREYYDGDRNWSDPSTSSLGTSATPMSRASSRDGDCCLPNSPGDISSVSSRKFDEISNARLKNTSKVSFSENPNARVSRTPSIEKLRSMFTHNLINTTEISSNVQN